MNVFIVLFVIFKRLKLQNLDCTHLVDFLMQINLPFLQKSLASQEAKIIKEKTMSNSLKYEIMIFFSIFKMIAFILLLAISKQFELQGPDCTHFEYFSKQINFFFLKFVAFQEAEIYFVEGVAKLISQIVFVNELFVF